MRVVKICKLCALFCYLLILIILFSLQGISHYEACKQYPDTMKQLDNLEKEISGGTTATVSLIYKNKLFVANVGGY